MSPPKRVGFISDPAFTLHDTGLRHPERPDRLRAIHRGLRLSHLLPPNTSPDPFPSFQIELALIRQAAMPLIELGYTKATREQLLTCHSEAHLDLIHRVCGSGGGVLDAGDTVVSPQSEDLAYRAAGCALSAVDAVLSGEVDRCFVAGRPPGHHAEPSRPMGFCLFSNMALAARHAIRTHNLSRVAIVDFDVHHGNGTQACLEGDPHILFASLHQHPQTCYPGTGFDWEIGLPPAKGLTLNLPLPPDSGDATYIKTIETKLLPRLREFKPQLLLLSAGFDAHIDDPLADMNVTDGGFTQIARLLCDASDDLCEGKIVALLEGGYNLQALARNVVNLLLEMQK